MVGLYDAEIRDSILTLIKKGTISKNPPKYRGRDRHDPSLFAKYMCTYFLMDTLPIEIVYLIPFDKERKPLGVIEVAEGTANEVILPIPYIMGRLLLINASSFIIFHNHPDTYGSDIKILGKDDKNLTYNVIKAGLIMGVPCLDHIIIGSDGFFSINKETNFFNEVVLNYFFHERAGVNLIGDDEGEEEEEEE